MNGTQEGAARQFKLIAPEAVDRRSLAESAAKMDRLPMGLEFPPNLRQRISFDPRRRRLSYYGFMTKSDYDRLRGLSPDATYQRALERLFRDSATHSIAVEIGIDQVLAVESADGSAYPVRTPIGRWIIRWGLMIACFAGGAALVWWCLNSLR